MKIYTLFLIPFLLFASAEFETGRGLEDNIYFASGKLKLQYDVWKIRNYVYGGWLTWMYFQENEGRPFIGVYTAGHESWYKNMFIKINHYCNHHIISNGNDYKHQEFWGGNLTAISIGIVIK